ncbi:MAG: 50S ribosomal protein L37ae [Nanoarchaeota archaeon]
MRTKKIKSAGRFGSKHGVRVRRKITEIESTQRKKQNCIFCNGIAKRISKGLWECKRCEKKFSGHTYFINKK